jgi:hypothetical protein
MSVLFVSQIVTTKFRYSTTETRAERIQFSFVLIDLILTVMCDDQPNLSLIVSQKILKFFIKHHWISLKIRKIRILSCVFFRYERFWLVV